MGWRFRKSIKLFPGVRLNLSRRGFSTTVGIPGASLNISRRGTWLNAGIPGTGISSRTRIDAPARRPEWPSAEPRTAYRPPVREPAPREVLAIGSAAAATLTSSRLQSLRLMLVRTASDRAEVASLLVAAEKRQADAERQLRRKEGSWISRTFFGGGIERTRHELREATKSVSSLRSRRDLCVVDAPRPSAGKAESAWNDLRSAFMPAAESAKVWDITGQSDVAPGERAPMAVVLQRRDVAFDLAPLDMLQSPEPAMRLRNANGGDLYVYPRWIVSLANTGELGIVDLADVRIEFREERFVEVESVPTDAVMVDRTWEKVNRDGSPDRRFADNRQIPVVLYGRLSITSSTGLKEEYLISNAEAAQAFAEAMARYRELLTVVQVKPA